MTELNPLDKMYDDATDYIAETAPKIIQKKDDIIAELLEALGRIAGVMSGNGLSKAQLRNQLMFAINTAKQAIHNAEEQHKEGEK